MGYIDKDIEKIAMEIKNDIAEARNSTIIWIAALSFANTILTVILLKLL